MIFVEWLITIIVAFFIARWAIKFDYKHNDGWTVVDIDEWWHLMVIILVLLVPYVNIFSSIIFLIVTVYQNIEGSYSVEVFVKKMFFIKGKGDKNEHKKY